MELVFTPQQFYDQRCSLVDVLRYWQREYLPEGLCAPFLEDLLVLRFPEFENNLRQRFSFFKNKAETPEEYFKKLVSTERHFYDRMRKRVL